MIICDDDQQIEIPPGRLAEMVRFLLDRAETITETPNIKVEYNCAGCRIQSKLVTFESEEAKIVGSIE